MENKAIYVKVTNIINLSHPLTKIKCLKEEVKFRKMKT